MITLAHLRSLLERALTHAENPAIVRLVDRTVEGLAGVYLPRTVWRSWVHDGPEDFRTVDDMRGAVHVDWAGRRTLDLTDPGTAHALLVALALALGLDPGPLALRISWHPGTTSLGERYWRLSNNTEARTFFEWSQVDGDFTAPNVAVEDDDGKALSLAVLHVLEHP